MPSRDFYGILGVAKDADDDGERALECFILAPLKSLAACANATQPTMLFLGVRLFLTPLTRPPHFAFCSLEKGVQKGCLEVAP